MPDDIRQLPIDDVSGDEVPSNMSGNDYFGDILASRRATLAGSIGAAIASFVGAEKAAAFTPAQPAPGGPVIGFKSIPVNNADSVVVPEGYRVQVILPQGTPLDGSTPARALPDQTGADAAVTIGAHHDGMHFFPIEGREPDQGSSSDGLLVLNHEYIEPRFMHARARGLSLGSGRMPLVNNQKPADEALKEIHAHGVAIVRIARQASGEWAIVNDPRSRRVHGATPMEITGPARGHALLRTKYSPEGTRTRGTLNNCAHGVTPWNTYLTCEENWAAYFVNRDQVDQRPALPREHGRYGVPTGQSRYNWDQVPGGDDQFARFNVSKTGADATQDYRNEVNNFGWVVEIDPFNPNAMPVKHTAMGRFAHEGVVFAPAREGQPVVAYSGCDSQFEYIYKFVSARPFNRATANASLLDAGTLYVGKFNADGSGEWLPLVQGQGPLTAANGFADQGEVLVNTRLAADAVGATKMDRPEWGAVDPRDGRVYFTLTNNSRRTAANADPANPRERNIFGHIIRWREAGDNHAATTFAWDIFLFAGDEATGRIGETRLTADNVVGCPDGLWFDAAGRLWVQSDIGESDQNRGPHAVFGNNQMLCANPQTGEMRRFLAGPVGQEVTGVTTTPDMRTMFVNLQHPGATTTAADWAAGRTNSAFPDGGVPRSATLVITKVDGGIIGS
jgi:secreted PhoX family phosphatase